MARYPQISSPCPLKWNGTPSPGLDFCGHCQRRVHNLDLMSESERITFVTGCKEDVCVSFTVKRSRMPLALGASMVAMAATAAYAAETPNTPEAPVATHFDWGKPTGNECPTTNSNTENGELLEDVLMGGVAVGNNIQWLDESKLVSTDKDADLLPNIAATDWLPTPKT